jgi:anaerobic ribonucleoside-triphosphate reductase activating protein
MRFAKVMDNDVVDGDGVTVSYWAQGCPLRCRGCHNEQTWDFNGGTEIDKEKLIKKILQKIHARGVERNFSVLGGEPLAPLNIEDTGDIIQAVRKKYPNITITLWTGYSLEELLKRNDDRVQEIFKRINYIITGRFEIDKRDISLKWRGSKNQIIYQCNMIEGETLKIEDVTKEKDDGRN